MIIFLDIDGVLNHENSEYGLEQSHIAQLHRLVSATNAQLVLTSTWKKQWYIDEKEKQDEYANFLDYQLAKWNLKISDKTIDDVIDRGQGIKAYVAEHKIEQYIILDDFVFPDYDDEIKRHLILIDGKKGLQSEDVARIKNLLGN